MNKSLDFDVPLNFIKYSKRLLVLTIETLRAVSFEAKY